MTRRGGLLFAAMSVIWGIPYLLIKVAVTELHPAVVVFVRTAVGAAILLPFAVRPHRGLPAVLARWRVVLAYAAIEVAGPWLLLTDAERRLSSSLSGLIIAVVPLLGAALAWAGSSSESFDGRRLLGLLIGFAGVAALLGLDVGGGGTSAWPVTQVLLTAVGYAVGPVIVSRRLADVPAVTVNAFALGVTALGYLPFAALHSPRQAPSPAALAAVAVLAVVCTATAFLLFFALIAEVGPARATVITYVNPAVAIALGVLLLGEPLTTGMVVGFPLVLLGSVLATGRARTRRRADARPVEPS